MPDTITARNESTGYTLPPAGQHQAVCVDTIDLGQKVESYQGGPEKLVWKIALVWQLDEADEQGQPFEVNQEYTLSFGEKAALRKLLSQWRGRSYTEEEARNGVPLHKLVGVNCMLTVEHKTSGSGKTYARVLSVSPLHKSLPKIAAKDYTRWDGWAKRKADYAEGATAFAAKANGGAITRKDVEEVFDGTLEPDDDLPF